MAILEKAGLYDKRLSAKPVRGLQPVARALQAPTAAVEDGVEIIVVRLRRHAGPGYVSGPSEALEFVCFGDGWALYDLTDVPEQQRGSEPENRTRNFPNNVLSLPTLF